MVSYKRVKRQEFRRLMKATMLEISGLGSKIGGGGAEGSEKCAPDCHDYPRTVSIAVPLMAAANNSVCNFML